METIKHFEIYIAAQKATGIQFVIFGILLLTAATLLHYSQLNPITQGLKNGFFAISVLLMASGIGFMMNQNKLLQSKTALYQSNSKEFEKQEIIRIQEVNKSVPKIILGLSIALIISILVLVLFVSQPLWKGVTFSVLIYLIGLLILESISYLSVTNYLNALLNL